MKSYKKLMNIIVFLIMLDWTNTPNVIHAGFQEVLIKIDPRSFEYIPKQLIIRLKEHAKGTKFQVEHGIVLTGIYSLDSLNKNFEVKSVHSIFQQLPKTQEMREVIEDLGINRTYILQTQSKESIIKIVSIYNEDSNIEFAQPNYLLHAFDIPNDRHFGEQWALKNNYGKDIQAERAWDIQKGDKNVIIAIIDTGVDHKHEDLKDKIWRNAAEIADNGVDDDGNGLIDDIIGYDFVDAPDEPGTDDEDYLSIDNDPMDKQGHGTHVAGIAAANTDNQLGIAGLCQKCTIMPIRAGYKSKRYDGNGIFTSFSAFQAIIYAVNNGADIINMSWGSYRDDKLIKSAISAGITKKGRKPLFIAASGNDMRNIDKTPIYPASYEGVIGVAATDKYDRKTNFSNYGKKIKISAPGEHIYSTYINNAYVFKDGTSMSTPFVSGLAGLILSKNASLSRDQIENIILDTSDNVDLLNQAFKGLLGRGRINAFKALQK